MPLRPTGRRGAAVCSMLLLMAWNSLAQQEGQGPQQSQLPLEMMGGQGPMVLPLRRKLRPDGEVHC